MTPRLFLKYTLQAGFLVALGGLALWLVSACGVDKAAIRHCARAVLHDTVWNPVFFPAVALILVLERLYPVNPKQRLFSAGFLHDGAWLVLGLVFTGTVVLAYAKGIRALYHAHFDFLTVKGMDRVPEPARLVLAVLLADFLAWFQHWLKHKVPWFWQFHAVHHSQREINMFTDLRFHYLEYIISRPIVLLPLLMLSIEQPKMEAYVLITTWYTRLYHGNIRANFGFLRHILVTPQSHRIHHSIDAYHRDQNFGVLFSFWDRIFRTRCEDHRTYPETGIEDPAFPLEKSAEPFSLVLTPLRQMVYPFIAIARGDRRDP